MYDEHLSDWLDERDGLDRDQPSASDLERERIFDANFEAYAEARATYPAPNLFNAEWQATYERELDEQDARDFLLGDPREYDEDYPF